MISTNKHITKNSQSGFSLIEVMVLMVVLSVSVAALMSSQSHQVLTGESQEHDALALQACEQKVEELRNIASITLIDFFDDYKAGTTKSNFEVSGLNLQIGDLDGMAGKITMPERSGDLDERLIVDDTQGWDVDVWDIDNSGGAPSIVADPDKIRVIHVRVTVQFKTVIGGDREREITAIIYGHN